jgi:hypothetical protein
VPVLKERLAQDAPPRRSAVSPVLAFIVIGVVATLVFGLRPVAALGAPSNVALAIGAAGVLRLIRIGVRNRPDFMDITFWVFVLVFFGIAAYAQLRANSFPRAHAGSYAEVVGETQLRIIVGIAAYLVGRRLAQLGSLPRVLAVRQEFWVERATVLAVVAVVLALPLIASVGVPTFFTSA